jgi:hypothetical protein
MLLSSRLFFSAAAQSIGAPQQEKCVKLVRLARHASVGAMLARECWQRPFRFFEFEVSS